MSALGQKQTLGNVAPMSALPPKADIRTQSRNVRFVPIADIRMDFIRASPSGDFNGLGDRQFNLNAEFPSLDRNLT
jgi:hypothetical protein